MNVHDPYAGKAQAIAHFYANVMKPSEGCRIWPFATGSHGYGVVGIKGKACMVATLACEANHGPCPEGYELRHLCGNKTCWAYEHLRWGTRSENMMDKVIHGTSNRGERQGRHVLSEEEVLEIRQLLAESRRTHESIAEAFGVSRRTIGDIKSRKSWFWLKPSTKETN